MGMVFEGQALTKGQVDALLADAGLASDIVFGPRDSNSGRLEALADEPLCEQLYLDKSWDLLRFLMNKAGNQDWSSELLFGDEALDAEETGYDQPRIRSIQATKAFAEFLQSLTFDQLLPHWNLQEMLKNHVYLVSEGMSADDERDLREYAGSYYKNLRDYVVKAAAADCALLLWIA